jgi:uncharacterized protein YbjQ (UPF0145 family)
VSTQDDRNARSIASIEAGGLPLNAQERMDDVRARGGRFFTSDLSVPEFLLAREAGFRPLTQVMGSSFYQVGWQYMPYVGSWSSFRGGVTELDTVTDAWNEARRLALGRLAQEATRAGADAVVGVRLERGAYDWAAGLLEFTAIGTAVVSERYELGEEPVLSNLSGQDFAKLFVHGYWPVGIVAATSVCYVVASWTTQNASTGFFGTGWQNQELTDYTQGFYDTRGAAMLRLSRQAHELGAHGVVGMEIDQEHTEREVDQNGKRTDLIVTMHMLGTAIVELEHGEGPDTYIAVPLDGGAR